MSTECLVVDASIADAFVGKFVARAASFKVSDPRDESNQHGTLIDT